MENDKLDSGSLWAKFVDSFEEYMSQNPFADMDDVYMTSHERSQMYKEATEELKARIRAIKQQKKKRDADK